MLAAIRRARGTLMGRRSSDDRDKSSIAKGMAAVGSTQQGHTPPGSGWRTGRRRARRRSRRAGDRKGPRGFAHDGVRDRPDFCRRRIAELLARSHSLARAAFARDRRGDHDPAQVALDPRPLAALPALRRVLQPRNGRRFRYRRQPRRRAGVCDPEILPPWPRRATTRDRRACIHFTLRPSRPGCS